MKIFSRCIILYIFLIISILSIQWGFLVHRTVHQLAVYKLPRSMQAFFYSNMDYIVKNSVRPDLRRNEDPSEATKHFIDLEAYEDTAAWKMPMNWDEAVKKYTRDSLIKYGYVPYHIITMKNRLTEAFRLGNKDSILFYAADIGHYIGDANVPLHTTLNYDGQLTNQRGLHSLWESTVPELELEQFQLYDKLKAHYLAEPEAAIWQAILRAHLLLKNVFGEEAKISKSFTDSTKFRIQMRNGREVRSYSTTFAKAYGEKLKESINDQLIHSAGLIADFWYTSWVDAGKPDLSGMLDKPFEKKDKKAMKSELKTYRQNKLIENALLMARKSAQESN